MNSILYSLSKTLSRLGESSVYPQSKGVHEVDE